MIQTNQRKYFFTKKILSISAACVLCVVAVFSVACTKVVPSQNVLTKKALNNLPEAFNVKDTKLVPITKREARCPVSASAICSPRPTV